MDLLNEKNKNQLLINDLRKLGRALNRGNDDFKLALALKLKQQALAKPEPKSKKSFP
ncbi:MAG: hypothetical protein UV78_C0073G0014 [Parcubacteria group bacterium GW2011_GWA2_43_17]|nr:MAG: hypothetical protein UV78_C0073G0014 [Parcubacteria group bacterium GW2011_GWA2_43_17]KKT94376.1 MAG: hypothetical protein UW91_C0002G0020 [Parcubacteria group bacterium GW2011_GWF2_45_11]KKT98704.1 MAG: hypothetical protein UW98_C0005G0024 [Parcubacteria group bacterium GW2011_GWC2_45_15]